MNANLLTAALLLAGQPSLQIQPAEVALTGPQATQRLLVLDAKGGTVHADVTKQAKFASSDPKVAAVDASGQVRAVGNGEAPIPAPQGDAKASARVKVERTQEAYEPSFANHVIPVLTKVGCNSG